MARIQSRSKKAEPKPQEAPNQQPNNHPIPYRFITVNEVNCRFSYQKCHLIFQRDRQLTVNNRQTKNVDPQA